MALLTCYADVSRLVCLYNLTVFQCARLTHYSNIAGLTCLCSLVHCVAWLTHRTDVARLACLQVNPDQEQVPQKVSTMAIKKNSPRLFRCPACPFFTKVKVDMDRHSHEHTEDKTYSCKLCRYETYWRGDMGRHLYRKHPNEVSKDSDLKEFFVYRPERRAISKGGKGVTACDKTPESDEGGCVSPGRFLFSLLF